MLFENIQIINKSKYLIIDKFLSTIIRINHILVPCYPNYVIHSSQCFKSPLPTDGFTFFKAYLKSSMLRGTFTYFQNSSIHFPSASFLPSPPYFFNFLLIGIQAASRQRFAISAPEYPSVCFTIYSKSISSVFSFFKFILISSLRPTSVGKGMQILFYNLRRIASSKSHGLFVAPTTTMSLPSSAPVDAPSILVISSVFTFLLAQSYFSPLLEASASISSIKIVVGEQNLAISKRILTSFYDQPFHFEAKLEAVTLKNVVFPVEAIALANKVLPVPGGPNSKTPFQALRIPLKR